MRAMIIFGGLILLMFVFVAAAFLEINTGFAERLWHNWISVQEAPVQGDLPWIAPHQKAVLYTKWNHSRHDGFSKIFEWGASPRATGDPQECLIRQMNFFQSFKNPEIPAGRCFLVSLDPEITLLQPAPSSSVSHGTHLPPGHSWWWFSPTLQQKPQALPATNGIPGPISFPGGKIVFLQDGSSWRVERH